MTIYSRSETLHHKLCGKLRIISKIPLNTRGNLSLAYTPGVAKPVLSIAKNPQEVYNLTIKGNTVAVITDGSAVLGLGNVGPLAALPVMEGKCAIFSEFAGLNAFPICLNTQKVAEIVQTIRFISPVFGAINLEDIASPRCFEIESQLQNLGIPVMHDDQHATAIVVLAGLINASIVTQKDLRKCKITVCGSGAAGTAITKLLLYYGVNNIVIVDKQGIISRSRKYEQPHKTELARLTNPGNLEGNLLAATINSDILIGVSQKNLFTKKIIKALNPNSIVFAMANPNPEIQPKLAIKLGVKIIATGRSDYPNQVNNALVFPGFFKGLLTYRKSKVTNEMKIKVAEALSSLVSKPSAQNIIPSIFNPKVVPTIVNCFKG